MSLVVDASVLVEVLLDTPIGQRARPILAAHQGELHMPELAVVEVTSVLRGLCRAGQIGRARAEQALALLRDFPACRWPIDPLINRAWALRDVVTTYDAMYIALAEGLGAELVTMDERLMRAAKSVVRCSISLVEKDTASNV